jgi:hypothetical protein
VGNNETSKKLFYSILSASTAISSFYPLEAATRGNVAPRHPTEFELESTCDLGAAEAAIIINEGHAREHKEEKVGSAAAAIGFA